MTKAAITSEQIDQAMLLREQGLSYPDIGNRLDLKPWVIRFRLNPKMKEQIKTWKRKRVLSIENRCKDALYSIDYHAKAEGHSSCLATVEQMIEAYKNQDACCAICGIKESDCTKRLHADHDHLTGIFRGWLCGSCNLAQGRVDEVGIEKFLEYNKKLI